MTYHKARRSVLRDHEFHSGLEFFGDVPILIDGSNVARHDQRHGWRVLMTLIDWLHSNKMNWFLYFDANILHLKEIDDDGKEFIKLQIADCLHTLICPGGVEADEFILSRANADGNHIISNDRYRQYASKYPWIDQSHESSNRRIHVFAVEVDKLCIPDLSIRVKILTHGTRDNTKIEECRKAAECGDIEAQFRLGLYYYFSGKKDGWWTTEDLKKAKKWLRMAAAQGHIEAQRTLGSVQCFLGLCAEVTHNTSEAMNWYRKAAEHGDPGAQCMLGDCYYNGHHDIVADKAEAVRWYRKAAEQGYAKAQHKLVLCYSAGIGIEQNLDEAEKWWRKIIAQDDGEAKSILERYSNAANSGDPEAQYQIGMLFWEDHRPIVNPWLAAKWFRSAAQQGHTDAQYKLGLCYSEEFSLWGGAVDDAEAVKWFLKAAEQGHADAQFKLGECYRFGQGVLKDGAEAKKWYGKAAEHGHEDGTKAISSQQ